MDPFIEVPKHTDNKDRWFVWSAFRNEAVEIEIKFFNGTRYILESRIKMLKANLRLKLKYFPTASYPRFKRNEVNLPVVPYDFSQYVAYSDFDEYFKREHTQLYLNHCYMVDLVNYYQSLHDHFEAWSRKFYS